MKKKANRVPVLRENYLDKIERIVASAKAKVVQAVNVALVYTYYEVGRIIVEEEQRGKRRAGYGARILENVSKRLTERFGRGWSPTNLEYMRKLFKVYSVTANPNAPIPQTDFEEFRMDGSNSKGYGLGEPDAPYPFRLSWSHYLVLMRIEDPEERRFYEIEAAENGWNLDELKRQFKSSLYERLALSRDKKGVLALAKRGQAVSKPEDVIKDPYVLEFLGLEEKERYSETELESRIIEHIEQFLLEMGKGFIKVGRQVRFTFQEKHFRVDLVFYNRILRCFVLVDLKTGDLTHGDIGQMQMYVNYYDRKVKMPDENPTIGILLCADKDDAIVEMTLPKTRRQIFASKYLTVLPDKETLRDLVRRQLGGKS